MSKSESKNTSPLIPAVKAKLLEGKRGSSSALPTKIQLLGVALRHSERSGLSLQ